jgi:hypothetical protein
MSACRLGIMDHDPVATSARRQTPRKPLLLLRLGAGRIQAAAVPGLQASWCVALKQKRITGRNRLVPGTGSGHRSELV